MRYKNRIVILRRYENREIVKGKCVDYWRNYNQLGWFKNWELELENGETDLFNSNYYEFVESKKVE